MKSLFLIINIIYCIFSLIIIIFNYLYKRKKIKRQLKFLCLISLIIYRKKKEDQEMVEILMSSIINYYKKLSKTKTVGEKMKGLHFIYL